MRLRRAKMGKFVWVSCLPADLRYRDLRRILVTEPGAAGGADDRIKSITGHKTKG